MTNAVMNVGVLVVLGVVVAPVLRRLRPGPLVWGALLLVVLTVVFDTLMIAADLYVFDPDLILGVYLWGAPVEDLAYALAASMLMPALWTWLGRHDDRHAAGHRAGHRAGHDDGAPRARSGPDADAAPGAGGAVREVLAASRPFSWVNTTFPFTAGYLMATGRIDVALVVGTLYFLGPYNLLMYGINDVFDYESDLRNPRKGGIEGALADPATARTVHRRILWACAATNIPFLVVLLALGGPAANLTLALVVFGVVAYSAPRLRLKERPVLDSLTSAMHFVGPLLYALVLTGTDLTARTAWPVLVAFVAWGMASHAFGAVQDVRADREGGLASVATVLGAHTTVVAATAAYVVGSLTLVALPWPGWLAALLPVPYAVNTARFWSVRDADCERAHHGWRVFLWLNLVTGFLVTVLLLVAARVG